MSVSNWEVLAAIWLISGVATLYLMDRAERDAGGDGRFTPLNFANFMTVVAVMSFWPVVLVTDIISQRRRAQGKDDDSVIGKAVIIMAAPFVILLLPVFFVALLIGFARRAIRGRRGVDPGGDEPFLLQIPFWPAPEEERAILARLTGATDSPEPPDLEALRETPEARLLGIAWFYVGLRLARLPDEEVFRRMEERRGATHYTHPEELCAYLQWRLQQDDPGGPRIESVRFAHVADLAVNWICDRYQEPAGAEFGPPDHLVEVAGLEAATPRPAETALLRLIMVEGDELYRCMTEDGDSEGILLIRQGCAVAHLPDSPSRGSSFAPAA